MQAHDTDRYKVGDADYSVKCVQCGELFEARRSDASFCSPNCRVAYSREPAKLNNAIAALEAMGLQLINMAQKYSRNQRVFEAMLVLRNRLNTALGQFEE